MKQQEIFGWLENKKCPNPRETGRMTNSENERQNLASIALRVFFFIHLLH